MSKLSFHAARLAKQSGFSLLEVMLVSVIMISFAVMMINYSRSKAFNARIDRAAAQIQQILQAASSYYVDNSVWPSCGSGASDTSTNTCQIHALIAGGYLPAPQASVFNNPWGNPYNTAWSTALGQAFVLSTDVSSPTIANVLRGLLPQATVNDTAPTVVITSIDVPGYNYNAAQNLKNGQIYNSGACVKVPPCPIGMQAQVALMPVVVSGTVSGTDSKIYDLQSFYAYAEGGNTGSVAPNACSSDTTTSVGPSNETCPMSKNQTYWRACVAGQTDSGSIQNYLSNSSSTSSAHVSSIQVMALTHCVPLS